LEQDRPGADPEALRQQVDALRHEVEALHEAARRRRRELSALVHELANPLGPLTTALYLLQRAPQERAPQLVEMSQRQLRLLTEVVEQLRRLGRENEAGTPEGDG
jgi:signal transduction histidine kinase